MKKTVYMEEMDAFTYRDKLKKDAVVFVPVGALEQHGSHMAMCVDAALTKAMAGATAEALVEEGVLEGIVSAPINYGYRSQQRSGGGFHLSGTTSLSGQTLIMLARDIVYNIIVHGARKIVFMNGHYENYQFIFEGAELALEKARANGIDDVKIQLLSYWDFVDDQTIAAELPNYDVLPIIADYTPPSGCLSHPGASSREKGVILRDVAVKNMVEAIKKEFV